MTLVFIDTETTGLDPSIHDAYEVAWAVDDGPVKRAVLPHALDTADEVALNIGRYHARGIAKEAVADGLTLAELKADLRGAYLVGSNPGFDAGFLKKLFGEAVWSHRMIDVSQGGYWVLGFDSPKGLAGTIERLNDMGCDIPQQDHTAVGDVTVTRMVFERLQTLAEFVAAEAVKGRA